MGWWVGWGGVGWGEGGVWWGEGGATRRAQCVAQPAWSFDTSAVNPGGAEPRCVEDFLVQPSATDTADTA